MYSFKCHLHRHNQFTNVKYDLLLSIGCIISSITVLTQWIHVLVISRTILFIMPIIHILFFYFIYFIYHFHFILFYFNKRDHPRVRERYQTKDLASKTTVVRVRYKFVVRCKTNTGYVQVLRSLWNASDDRLFVEFSFGIERCLCIVSLSTFLDALASSTDLRNCKFHW